MKTICTILLLLISLSSNAQCVFNQLPNPPSNLVLTENRPHTDPYLNWPTVYEACDYVINAKVVTKRGNVFTEQQAAGYPFIVINNANYTQQGLFDTRALQLTNFYNGAITIKYEIYSRNNIGNSSSISSRYVKIN